MVVDEELFPLVFKVNTSATVGFKEALAIEKAKEHAHIPKIKKAWILRKYLLPINKQLAPTAKERRKGDHPYTKVHDATRV